MYTSILVPTDGSPPAKAAVAHAIALADLHGAKLHAIYCVEPIPLGKIPAGAEAASTEYGEVIDLIHEAGDHVMAEVDELARAEGVTVETEVVHGSPAMEILDFLEGHDVDLVVIGTEGRTGAGRFLMGSVAEKVVRRSPVPVLTIRQPDA